MASEERKSRHWGVAGAIIAAVLGAFVTAALLDSQLHRSICAASWANNLGVFCHDPDVSVSAAAAVALPFAGTLTGATPNDAEQYVDQNSIAKSEVEQFAATVRPNHVVWWQLMNLVPNPDGPRNSFYVTYKEYVLLTPRVGQVNQQRRSITLATENNVALITSMTKPDIDGSTGQMSFPRVVFSQRTYLYKNPRLDPTDNLQNLGIPAQPGTELTGLCDLAVPSSAPAHLTAGDWVRTRMGWVPASALRPDTITSVMPCGQWLGLQP